jgi:ankyrin repeat protein
LNGRT